MTARILLFAALTPLLSACGDDARDAVPEETAPRAAERRLAAPEATAAAPAPDRRAGASDVLGTFEGEVFGLAMWEHPDLSFGSAVLAANGEAGLAIVPIDQEVEGSVTPGTFDGPVAVGYAEGASYVAAASGAEIEIFSVGTDRTLTSVGTVAGDPHALCMVGDVLLAVADEARAYRIGEDGTAAPVFTAEAPDDAYCAATDARFFVGAPGSPLTSFTADGSGRLVDDAYAGAPLAGLAALGTPDGPALVYLRRGALFVDAPGVGHTRVGIAGAEDRAAMPRATSIAAGSGNFGSIYRDGVVALVAEGELILVPWAAIARAAGLDAVETASFRPRPEPDGPARDALQAAPPDIRTPPLPPDAD